MHGEATRRWRDHLPAVLILGSPVVAACMAHGVGLVGHFLVPELKWVTVGAAIILRLNAFLGVAGSAAGAVRVHGSVSTRVAVTIASGVFAAAVYAVTIGLTFTLIPGYANRYGID